MSPEASLNREFAGGEVPFSPKLRRILYYAPEEARYFNHDYVGSEHILLALLHDEEVASKLGMSIETKRLNLQNARVALDFIVGKGETMASELSLTPMAKKILRSATNHSRKDGSSEVRLNHLISALFETEGISSGVLESLDVESASVLKRLQS